MPERLIRDSSTIPSPYPDGSPEKSTGTEEFSLVITGDLVEVRFISEPMEAEDKIPAFGLLVGVRIVDMKDGLTLHPDDCLFVGEVIEVRSSGAPKGFRVPMPTRVTFSKHSVRRLLQYGPLNFMNPDRQDGIPPLPIRGSALPTHFTTDPTKGGKWIPITPDGEKEPLLLCRDSQLAKHLAAFLSALLSTLRGSA